MARVTVPYAHDPADLSFIYLAVTRRGTAPAEDSWVPAYRDTVDGKLVVWADFPTGTDATTGAVWLRDRTGERQVVTAR